MRHGVSGWKLNRNRGHRTALFRNIATALLLHERIETTEAKAKATRPLVDRMITIGKSGNLTARRRLWAMVPKKAVVEKTLAELSERFRDRPGGYSRIRRIRRRKGDNAGRVIFELVDVQAGAGNERRPKTRQKEQHDEKPNA